MNYVSVIMAKLVNDAIYVARDCVLRDMASVRFTYNVRYGRRPRCGGQNRCDECGRFMISRGSHFNGSDQLTR